MAEFYSARGRKIPRFRGLICHRRIHFRPAPVEQPRFAAVSAVVADGAFANQRALVVGGSRGLGETTAKILAAGGADVTMTYCGGETDARKVESEIRLGGGRCATRRIDVLAASLDTFGASAGDEAWSHVYYFASPRIEPHRGPGWNDALFHKYARYYLAAFSDMVAIIGQAAQKSGTTVAIFYPSSILIESPEKGFAEYAVVKASGEALCDQLRTRYANVHFYAPRLPRMATDQTASIIPLKMEPALSVMTQVLNRWAFTDGKQKKQAHS